MTEKTENTKRKIREAAEQLLAEYGKIEQVTMRRIAERAEVGVGLINYHFGSRDELLHVAINEKLRNQAVQTEKLQDFSGDPVTYLLTSIINLTDMMMADRTFHAFTMEYELKHGGFKTCMYLVPPLKAIFKEKKTDMEIRLIAFQIIASLQVGLLKEKDFQVFSGFDIEKKEERDQLIESLVRNLIKE